ncbi:unnamed protein product [Mytilus coruscus]|uniref:CARD domain-containing protein n=1 Tax=Mytilus coruscus TaxID=42192 RepID=A0A6J8A127_MYTCO|nr:unnamed protein product [Mytilus coruscus]
MQMFMPAKKQFAALLKVLPCIVDFIPRWGNILTFASKFEGLLLQIIFHVQCTRPKSASTSGERKNLFSEETDCLRLIYLFIVKVLLCIVDFIPRRGNILTFASKCEKTNFPQVLEKHIKRTHNIDLHVAIEKTEEDLRRVLTAEELSDLYHMKRLYNHHLYPYYHGIVHNTKLDSSIMDFLITMGIMTVGDRDEVDQCASQTRKNKLILDKMMDQSENACELFLKAVQRDFDNFAETCMKKEQEVDMGEQIVNQEIGHNSIRIMKNYDMLVREMSNTVGIIDHLISKEVLDVDDMQEIESLGVQSEMNRKLISKIKTDNGYSELLMALNADVVNSTLVDKIESTSVTEEDIERYKPTSQHQSFGTSLGLSIMISLCVAIDRAELPKVESFIEDNTVQKDLTQLKVHMNFIVEEEEISEEKYSHLAIELTNIIQRLGGEDVKRSCEKYFMTSCCVNEMNCLLDKIKRQKRKASIRRQITEELEEEMKIPKNIREQHYTIINEWKRNDKVFSVTHSTERIMQSVSKNSQITIVGSPGSGKTSIARHVALKLIQNEKYQIVPIYSADEILLYGDIKSKQVFVIDDILGVFGVDMNKINYLESRADAIINLLKTSGSKLIMTCRKAVFNTITLTTSVVAENAFDVDHEENKLSNEDKKAILEIHCMKKGVSPAMYDSLSLDSAVIMFPLLCKLFSNEKRYQMIGARFFTHPYECLLNEVQKNQERNKAQYAALVMCMINGGKLSMANFPATVIKEDVYEHCEIDKGTSSVTILKALEQLIGTYTEKAGNQFSFIHDSLFEVMAYHYGKQYPDQILKYSSTSYIANMVTVGDAHTTLCIQLQEHDYHLLAERIYNDIQHMELNYVFRNTALKYIKFFKIFKQMLENKPYKEITDLFLQNQYEKNCTNIVDQGEKLLRELNTEDVFLGRALTRSQDTLMNKRIKKDNSVTYHIRVLSWVVFYGHKRLLRYLLHLVLKHNDSPCEIFGETTSEQTRLLILGCCSGDLDTLDIVLNNVKHECLNATLLQTKEDFETKKRNKHRCKTPLTAAYMDVGEASRCISKLIEMGSDVHKMDELGHVPILNAAYSGNKAVLKALLDANADINYGNNGKSSPLFTAASLNHLDAVKILIEFGASVNKGKSDNTTPLFRTAERGNLEIARFLIKNGANVNLCDTLKRSPLHGASIQGFRHIEYKVIQEQQCQVVELLLNNGARVNATDKYNRSPLFLASQRGHYELANIFLQNNADPNIIDSFQRSPLFVASQNRHHNIVDLLVEHGAHKNIRPKWTYEFWRNRIAFISSICTCIIVLLCFLAYFIFQ